MATSLGDFEAVIGLEVHAQLLTRTKAFCGCSTSFGDEPNTHTCPVCLGLPGALPVLNREAVRMAVAASLALGCEVQPTSVFSRKNYFYPDLPKGYQISQFDKPLALRGGLDLELPSGPKRAVIHRVHMEEDAGKNLHGVGDESIVDLNRAGTPLLEIVGEPDLRSGDEAAEYLRRLRELLMFIGVNDGNLEQGSFRCDANVSVRKKGDSKLGTRVELKNINSFRFVADAIEIEARRQVELLSDGGRVRMETRGYNAEKRETYLLRAKETDSDYRYFPEPDLPPLTLDEVFVAEVYASLAEAPASKRRRMTMELGLAPNAASVLTSHPRIAGFFEDAAKLYRDPVKVANYIQSEVMRDVMTTGLDATFPVTPGQLADLLRLVDEGVISGKQAKEVYAAMVGTTDTAEAIVRARGMRVVSDEGELEAVARRVLADNEKQLSAYRAGKLALFGYFVGQVMKATRGSADPKGVNEVLARLLSEPASGEVVANASPKLAIPPAPAVPPNTVRVAKARGREPSSPAIDLSPSSSLSSIAISSSPLADSDPPASPSNPSPMAKSVAPAAEPPTLTSASGVPAIRLTDIEEVLLAQAPVPMATFTRLDLRVGIVVSCARVEGRDRLLSLLVDVGDESGPRRLFAPLGRSYAPEYLVNERVIVAVNVEPRTLDDGLVSYGVLLVASAEGSSGGSFITVSRDLPAGTRVKG